MAHSIKTYTGDGVTTDFLFDIPYIKEADVHGYETDVEDTGLTFVDPTHVRFVVAPADGSIVKIKRLTEVISARYTFPNKTYINSTRLDGNSEQQLYLHQESIDYSDENDALASEQVPYAAEWAKKAEDSLISVEAGGNNTDDYSALHWANKSAEYGRDWAITIEDTLVPVAAGGNGATDYSALHWAAKSSTSAAAALVSENNNIIFEVGVAVGLGKDVILLAPSGFLPPYDLSGMPIVLFDESNIEELQEKLSVQISNLHNISSRKGNYSRSLQYLEHALALAKERKNDRDIAAILNNLSTISYERGVLGDN